MFSEIGLGYLVIPIMAVAMAHVSNCKSEDCMTNSALLKRLRAELEQAGDAKKAVEMQAYMKSAMPYHGVQTPLRQKICKAVFSDVAFPKQEEWQTCVLCLWRQARFREERYAALTLAADRRARAFQTPKVMPMYEEMVLTGAWWDYVDDIASHHVGFILGEYPAQMKRMMLAWSQSDNMWKRRVSILCQLSFKSKTDLKLLYSCIEPSLSSKEFFLQKAIGWALRQYAWTNPSEVRRFVLKNRAHLSPLSQCEALKNLD